MSKFLTLNATYFEVGGPISKFQSGGIFIYIRLSISTLNFASGALEIQESSHILTNFGVKMVIF